MDVLHKLHGGVPFSKFGDTKFWIKGDSFSEMMVEFIPSRQLLFLIRLFAEHQVKYSHFL